MAEEKTLERLALELIGSMALVLSSIFLSGLTMCMLWKWFIVSHFGVQPLPYVIGIGLGLFAGYITHHSARSKVSEDYKWIYFIEGGLYKHLMALGLGWIIHLFV
jgi:hypothetical protein